MPYSYTPMLHEKCFFNKPDPEEPPLSDAMLALIIDQSEQSQCSEENEIQAELPTQPEPIQDAGQSFEVSNIKSPIAQAEQQPEADLNVENMVVEDSFVDDMEVEVDSNPTTEPSGEYVSEPDSEENAVRELTLENISAQLQQFQQLQQQANQQLLEYIQKLSNDFQSVKEASELLKNRVTALEQQLINPQPSQTDLPLDDDDIPPPAEADKKGESSKSSKHVNQTYSRKKQKSKMQRVHEIIPITQPSQPTETEPIIQPSQNQSRQDEDQDPNQVGDLGLHEAEKRREEQVIWNQKIWVWV